MLSIPGNHVIDCDGVTRRELMRIGGAGMLGITLPGILALEEQSVDERDITSLLVSVDSERLPEAKKRIRDFRNDFIKEFNNESEKKDSVYCLGIQLLNWINSAL